jgi:hypothetical protein
LVNNGYPPPAKKQPSCWVFGILGCLGILIIGGIVIGIGVTSFMHSPQGKMFTSAVNGGASVPIQMAKIREAIKAYKTKTGEYPATLEDLVPTYLPDRSVLHNPLDMGNAPDHISYEYTKPASDASSNTVILTFTWDPSAMFKTAQSQTTQGQSKVVYSETLGGTLTTTRYQNGSVVSTTSMHTTPASP